jgi:hypothetical protein
MCYRNQLLQKEQLLQHNSSELSNHFRHCDADGEFNELLQQELKQAKVNAVF